MNINAIDLIVLITIMLFTLFGLAKGFLLYIIELLITVISLGVAWFYYRQNHLLLKSFLVCLCVFLGLSILKWLLLRPRRKDTSLAPSRSRINQLLGGALGFLWGTIIATLLIFAMELIPSGLIPKYNIQDQVRASTSFRLIKRLIPTEKVKILENISYMSKVNLSEEVKKKLMEQPEFQKLLEHKSLKALMEDPETVNQLKNKDIRGLLNNRKIIDLLNDGQFLEKLLELDFKQAYDQYYKELGK